MKKIAITMGDPAGIGPEIILKSLPKIDSSKILLIGNNKIFTRLENLYNLKIPKTIEFYNIEYDVSNIQPAIENKNTGELAYLCLKKACDLVIDNVVQSIATAPLSKKALNLAGYNYSGQTEILQNELGSLAENAQMLFVAEKLRVLLLTRHIPLKNIPNLITKENIVNTAKILNLELKNKFNIKKPKIAMCSLNPHAGENGILGDEELNVINPAINYLQTLGIDIYGSYSADFLLSDAVKNYKNPKFDAYISCYHDQSLPAVKSLGFDKVLNITIGLKALRVSPSHGTAFDIAYKNIADYNSMLNAIKFLENLL